MNLLFALPLIAILALLAIEIRSNLSESTNL